MNWRKWKMGLVVSGWTGLLTGLCAYQIAEKIDVVAFLIFLAISTAKDMLLFLRNHPIEKVKRIGVSLFALALICAASGCTGYGAISRNLSKDGAIVRAVTPYGTFTRIGNTTNRVKVTTAGEIFVNE